MKYVHIAGTNGKGSVAEYIYQIIMAAGESAGCYTSPHLVSSTERFRANGREIDATALDNLLCEVEQKKLAVNDSLFAAYTAAALLWFRRLGVEYAVLETGLGGRLDPTNVVVPKVSVITSISYDHMDVLGGSIESIALEKCGIIKPGVPVVSSQQLPVVEEIILATAQRLDSPVAFLPPVCPLSASLLGQTFETQGRHYAIGSIGETQPGNAALAALAARQIGFEDSAISKGLGKAVIPCRAQYIPGSPDMLLDGAHNAGSVQALCNTLDRYFASERKTLLFACMNDKDISAMTAYLSPYFHEAVVTTVDSERGADCAYLETLFSRSIICRSEHDPVVAFAQAKSAALQTKSLLVVCGSFYLAGMIHGLHSKLQ